MKFAKVEDGQPVCSRCGLTSSILIDGDAVLIDDGGLVVCPSCMTYEENRDNGRRILAGLEAEADALRRQWLGDDLDDLSDKQRRERGKRRPKPVELDQIIRQIQDVEETLEEIEFTYKWEMR